MKWEAQGEAIPIYQQLKDVIATQYAETLSSQKTYRESHNPMDLYDFANNVVTLYGLVSPDLGADEKLAKDAEELKPLDDFSMRLPHPTKLNPQEWSKWFVRVQKLLYTLNLIRLTRDKDDDNDFSGTPGMHNSFKRLEEKLEGMMEDD